MLGGAGLVGRAIARQMLPFKPRQLVISALREDEAREGVDWLRALPESEGVEIVPEWGDIFLRAGRRGETRAELLYTSAGRTEILDDMFGAFHAEESEQNLLYYLLVNYKPNLVIDCINTATAIAYQDLFSSARGIRDDLAAGSELDASLIEAHLTTLYLPQLIRHVQNLLRGMRVAETTHYLKIGTSGTGGMGLNVPFTHSEDRPSATLLSKASVAGAHSMLLFLMGRTPDAPVVKEIKPTAAIGWKRIEYGPVTRGGRPIERHDSTGAVDLSLAFEGDPADMCRPLGDPLESVFLDAGENGLFSLSEFETISALGLMEIITPEEIADVVIAEITGRPTGKDIVGALDASSMGPTYRAGALREAAMSCMERLEEEHDVKSVAFEMLGPPRLSKLLFEASLLERLYDDVFKACDLDPEETASRAAELIESDARLRSDIVSVGIPILMPDGERLMRGPKVSVGPASGTRATAELANRGWVDLRPSSWEQWRERCRSFVETVVRVPGAESGSSADLDERSRSGEIRPGALGAFVFRFEDKGERTKR
jgi:hypothetical protein